MRYAPGEEGAIPRSSPNPGTTHGFLCGVADTSGTDGTGGKLSWRDWTYSDWNRELLRHSLGSAKGRSEDPIERIPATPEELLLVVDDRQATTSDALAAFLSQVKAQVPRGECTFSRFCYDYKGWSVSSAEPPHFFGMLWLTCLAAYGYPPDATKSFHKRMWDLLGKTDNLQRHNGDAAQICLPKLWLDLKVWLGIRKACGDTYNEILLPTEVGIRTGIGQSWFLAFPHIQDRSLLAKLLWDSGLVGFEPPVHRVLEVLEATKREFSRGLQEDLADFQRAYAQGAVSAKASAFWRAVRQEALSPCVTRDGARRQRGDRVELLVADTQDGFQPLICGGAGWDVPTHYSPNPLPEPVGPLTSYLRGKEGSLEEPAEDAFVYGKLLGLSHGRFVEQGMVLLREHSSELYTVVSGSEAHGVVVGLVRDDLVDAFRRAFGGKRHDALIEGWSAIAGCSVKICDVLPTGLEGALQLLPTMYPRVVASSGGIRIAGGFLRALHFLPHLHANGADSVVMRMPDGSEYPCAPVEEEGHVEWRLPEANVPASGELVARATWPVRGAQGPEVAETMLRFEEEAPSDAYKPLGSGTFGLEACLKPEMHVRGGEEIYLGVTTNSLSETADLFSLEPQVRYLGPGLGEMSVEARPGYDWLTLGSFKNPDALLFIGDPEHPIVPAQAQAAEKGARRHWRDAFTKPTRCLVRTPEGAFRPVSEFPKVLEALVLYRRHMKVASRAALCPTVSPDGLKERPEGLVTPDVATDEAVAAIAALSVRKAGLSHKEVSEILTALLPKHKDAHGEDYLALQQLLRAWTECGQLDVLREVRGGHLAIVARRPRLVFVRRGPSVEARLVGLLNPATRRRAEALSKRLGVSLSEVEAPNRWQPSILRFRGGVDELETLAKEAEFAPSEWLHWPSLGSIADHFNVTAAYQEIRPDLATPAFKVRSAWDWVERQFTRDAYRNRPDAGVVIERRLHPDGSAVHVVIDDGKPVASSFLRNWALLFAYDLAGQTPFSRRDPESLACEGASPVHLPLPIARLCAITGAGLPGPRFDERTGRVQAYEYPFGRRLVTLLETVIPGNWISP
jgi:hypothetical protein